MAGSGKKKKNWAWLPKSPEDEAHPEKKKGFEDEVLNERIGINFRLHQKSAGVLIWG